jgi:predicted TIM-barrel fold metal-dependent hydrolase
MSRIDVHQHFVPDFYAASLRTQGIEAAGGRDLPEWSAGDALALMDRYDVGTAVLSLSTPGTVVGDGSEAVDLARRVNELGAKLSSDQPDRFGFFATVPLPDLDAATAVATEALDDLGADGVTLLANNGGVYLGAPAHDELLAELDARSAVVFVHPHTLPGPAANGIPPYAVDFLLDTTRAAANLVLRDVPRRFPNLKIILAHGGGFVPYAAHRIAAVAFAETGRDPAAVLEDLASFYFDTALSGSPSALPSLMTFAKPGHVLFGSDWPYAPELAVAYFTGCLDNYDLDHAAVNRDNALALFPRLSKETS